MNLLNFLGAHLLPALGRASIQAAMVVAAVLLVQWLFRDKLAPRWRCALWMLLMARLLWPVFPASPASIFNFAHWSIRGAHFGGASSRASTAPQTITGENREGQPLAGVASAARFFPANMPPAPGGRHLFWDRLSWTEWVVGIWLAGALVLLSRLVISTIALSLRFSRRPQRRDPALMELLGECCQLLGVRRRPAMVECEGLGSPAMHGLFRPQLLLPQGFAAKFSTRELRFVFLHELAHLKRWDLPLHWVAAGLQIVHWFNPLVWLAFARWRADREMACDAAALEALGAGQNHDYGRTVLDLLESLARNPPLPGVIGILDRDNLERRIQMIARFRPGPRWPVPALLLVAGMSIACLTDPQGGRPGTAEIVQKLSIGGVKNFENPMKLDLSRFRDYRLLPGDPYFGALAGDRVYDGVPFQIDGRVSLYGRQEAGFARWRHFHDITGIPVGRKFDELHLLHETRWADVEGETIARYRLHYADGTTADLPIRYGVQVRDASRLPTEEKEAISDPSTKIVWRNIRPDARPSIRVFKSVLLNPSPEKVVASIDVISARHLASYDLLAATVCKRNPKRNLTAAIPWMSAAPALDGELAVRVTDKATGQPLGGVLVNPWMSVDGQGWIAAPFYTASNGQGILHYSKAHTSWIGMEAEKSGYAQGAKFLRHERGEQIPSECVVELTATGQPVGGGMASLR